MTAVADALQADLEGISQPRAVVVGIMAGEGVQIGVLLDANAPVSVMTDPLLKVVNSRLRELGETPLEATGRGKWASRPCWTRCLTASGRPTAGCDENAKC